MRNFDALLFLGNGELSEQCVEKLRQILEEAVTMSGGNQQGPSIPRIELGIQDAVRDIAAALTGRSIEFGDRLPYPGRLNGRPFRPYDEE